MDQQNKSLGDLAKTVGGSIAAVIGLLAAVAQLTKQVPDTLSGLSGLPLGAWWLLLAVLIAFGISCAWNGLKGRSRLLAPDALTLRSDNPEHLRGRDDDVDRLLRLCREFPQVHLVGESGAGKSAVVQAGLSPKLIGVTALPVYIASWGGDWSTGPLSSLAEAVSETIHKDLEVQSGLQPFLPITKFNVFSILLKVQQDCLRSPVLIFDQFDDYQTRHRSLFLSGSAGTWSDVATLVNHNEFWAEVNRHLLANVFHVVFVTRADTADGLESVRFLTPKVYRLDRLKADFILPLLTEMTDADGKRLVVSNPERGWTKLRERLARDLTQEGSVLPVQMRLALQGLGSLRRLTVADYDRAGGLRGLEAKYIENHLAQTASHAGLDKATMRKFLKLFVDSEKLKTIPRSASEIAGEIGDPSSSALRNSIEIALDDLETKEVLRKRVDPETQAEVWLLDHDYLCRGVLEAERRVNKWFALAQERCRQFEESSASLWQRWRALLSPWDQVALLFQRIRGDFEYGRLRKFAVLSMVRFAPLLLLLGIVLVSWRWETNRRITARARTLTYAIGHGITPSADEWDALWDLATSERKLRLAFIRECLNSEDAAKRIFSRGDIAVQSAVGMDDWLRRTILNDLITPRLVRDEKPTPLDSALIRVGRRLDREDEAFRKVALKRALALLESGDTSMLRFLDSRDGEYLFNELPADAVALFVTRQWQESLTKFDSDSWEKAFSNAFFAILKRTPPDKVREMVLTAQSDESTESGWHYLSRVIDMTGQLTPQEQDAITSGALEMLTKVSDSSESKPIIEIIERAIRAAPSDLLDRLSKACTTAFLETSDDDVRAALAKALCVISKQGTDDSARVTLQIIFESKQLKESDTTDYLMGLADQVVANERRFAVPIGVAILQELRFTKEPESIRCLGELLFIVGKKASKEDTVILLQKVQDELGGIKGEVAHAAALLPFLKLDEKPMKWDSVKDLVAALFSSTPLDVAQENPWLNKALATIGAKLPPTERNVLLRALLSRIASVTTENQAKLLTSSLDAVLDALPAGTDTSTLNEITKHGTSETNNVWQIWGRSTALKLLVEYGQAPVSTLMEEFTKCQALRITEERERVFLQVIGRLPTLPTADVQETWVQVCENWTVDDGKDRRLWLRFMSELVKFVPLNIIAGVPGDITPVLTSVSLGGDAEGPMVSRILTTCVSRLDTPQASEFLQKLTVAFLRLPSARDEHEWAKGTPVLAADVSVRAIVLDAALLVVPKVSPQSSLNTANVFVNEITSRAKPDKTGSKRSFDWDLAATKLMEALVIPSSPQNRAEFAERVAATILATTDEELLRSYCGVFKALGSDASPQTCNSLTRHMIRQALIARSLDSIQLLSRTMHDLPVAPAEEDVVSLVRLLKREISAPEAESSLLDGREKGQLYFRKIASAAEIIQSLPGKIPPTALIDFLKSPFCVGDLRDATLKRFEKEVNAAFHGDLWAAADWAASHGIDPLAPPTLPIRQGVQK